MFAAYKTKKSSGKKKSSKKGSKKKGSKKKSSKKKGGSKKKSRKKKGGKRGGSSNYTAAQFKTELANLSKLIADYNKKTGGGDCPLV